MKQTISGGKDMLHISIILHIIVTVLVIPLGSLVSAFNFRIYEGSVPDGLNTTSAVIQQYAY